MFFFVLWGFLVWLGATTFVRIAGQMTGFISNYLPKDSVQQQ